MFTFPLEDSAVQLKMETFAILKTPGHFIAWRNTKLVSHVPGLNILSDLVDDVFFTLLPSLQMQTEATGPSVTT